MSRRRKDPFANKENVRHFRLVHRPLGEEVNVSGKTLTFEEMFEEYDPMVGKKNFLVSNEETEVVVEREEFYEEAYEDEVESGAFNDSDDELVDIDAELDQFAEDFIDIEGDEVHDQVRPARFEEKVGESAKYGILFDDRNYDYTKHLRFMGVTPGAVFMSAPGRSKKSTSSAVKQRERERDFFSAPDSDENQINEDIGGTDVPEIDMEAVLESHESARQQYRSLLHQASDDPMLKEVLEALEDDRFVSQEIDDELVLALDNIKIHDNDNVDVDVDDFFYNNGTFSEEIDIIGESEEEKEKTVFKKFIPSVDLKERMKRFEERESQLHDDQEEYDSQNEEFDKILNEYEEESEIDIIGEDDEDSGILNRNQNRNIHHIHNDNEYKEEGGEGEEVSEEAKEVLNYLREHGRARGTTLYDKKRPSHLPPIHIAIAQYSELRRELGADKESIIKKYAEEDSEEIEEEMRESERIIQTMVQMYDREENRAKDININNVRRIEAKNKTEKDVAIGPQLIIEESASVRKGNRKEQKENVDIMSEEGSSSSSSSSSSSENEEEPKINKGAARNATETPEEKKARKAQIKAEKREKRTNSANDLDPFVHVKKAEGDGGDGDVDIESFLKEFESSSEEMKKSEK